MDPERVIAALADDVLMEAPPVPLTGGQSASIHRFSLAAGPDELTGRDLVLRVQEPPASSTEAVIQREVGRAGYPTPTVHRFGEVEGHAWGVMDFAEGKTLFDADRAGAMRRIPVQLAGLMADFHQLDPGPVDAALPDAPDPVDAILAELDPGSATDWLHANRPATRRRVVCHNDLHALNVLATDQGPQVIDWELASVGHPVSDVARTVLSCARCRGRCPGSFAESSSGSAAAGPTVSLPHTRPATRSSKRISTGSSSCTRRDSSPWSRRQPTTARDRTSSAGGARPSRSSRS
ncbi:MAG: phosphotransferase [Acidimicrobiales bacterium]|nr:phosphotransferase [Acidimicrobiales bacterium]